MTNLPIKYTERMKQLLGSEYTLYEESVNLSPVKAFRVNTDKISLEDFEKINALPNEKIPYVPNGYYLMQDKIGAHPFHHAGVIYVQEPAAMAPAECVEIEKDWKILDMCAAPGGKSSQLKNKLGENGVLVSNEIVPSRCRVLTGNIERLGLTNTVTTCTDTERLSRLFPKTFDLVMVDAPCSGEGMFRKDENARNEWSEENVLKCAERQKEILENAALCVKNGGYIIYATCTFSLEENEMVIDSFLKAHNNFVLSKVTDRVEKATSPGIDFDGCECKNISFARRFYPHKGRGEGQFMAVLKNTESPQPDFPRENGLKKCTDRTVLDFLSDNLDSYKAENVLMNKNTPVYFTPDFAVPGGVAFSCGVTIGEIKKNYILPHHQLFMAMGNRFKRKINLSLEDENLMKYLKGDTFAVSSEKGFAAVLLEGCTLGGAKIVDGKIKNHYPKGLRIV